MFRKGWTHKCAKRRYGFGISWDDTEKSRVDLDIQAIIVDKTGHIIDAAYYNNPSAMNRAVQLSKDERNGENSPRFIDECVWINLRKLPEEVTLILIVVAAYTGGALEDAQNGVITVMQEYQGNFVKNLPIEQSAANADVVAMLKREPDTDKWTMCEIKAPAALGSHFLDILEPTIGGIIRAEIAGAPKVQKVTFMMEKGALVDFSEDEKLRKIIVGIGGMLKEGATETLSMDISAVFFSSEGKVLGAVDLDTDELFGVRLVQESANSSDEAMTINLLRVPQKVTQVFIVLTLAEGSFQSIDHAYARVTDQTLTELVRFDIAGGRPESGLIISRLFRSAGKRWGFQSLGDFCSGPTWKAATGKLDKLFRKAPHQRVGAKAQKHAAKRMSDWLKEGTDTPKSEAPSAPDTPTGGEKPSTEDGDAEKQEDGHMLVRKDKRVPTYVRPAFFSSTKCSTADSPAGEEAATLSRNRSSVHRGTVKLKLKDLLPEEHTKVDTCVRGEHAEVSTGACEATQDVCTIPEEPDENTKTSKPEPLPQSFGFFRCCAPACAPVPQAYQAT